MCSQYFQNIRKNNNDITWEKCTNLEDTCTQGIGRDLNDLNLRRIRWSFGLLSKSRPLQRDVKLSQQLRLVKQILCLLLAIGFISSSFTFCTCEDLVPFSLSEDVIWRISYSTVHAMFCFVFNLVVLKSVCLFVCLVYL